MASTINGTSTGSGGLISTGDDSGILNIQTNETTAITVDASQNVGVGVTPSIYNLGKALEVGALGCGLWTPAVRNIVMNSNAYYDSGNKYATTGAASSYQQANGAHNWYQAASGTIGNAITFTQAMTLDASGNLLVGTTSAGTDKVRFSSNGATANQLGLVSADDSNGNGFIQFRKADITSIGSITRVGATNAVAYNTTSDYRLKTVVGAVTGQGTRIDALKPIDYLWIEGGQQARGFLAHEFQAVYPNSVTGIKDDVDAEENPKYQAMQAATSEVIADLVAEIQSLRQRITALEGA
jgi:hypothetical protein